MGEEELDRCVGAPEEDRYLFAIGLDRRRVPASRSNVEHVVLPDRVHLRSVAAAVVCRKVASSLVPVRMRQD